MFNISMYTLSGVSRILHLIFNITFARCHHKIVQATILYFSPYRCLLFPYRQHYLYLVSMFCTYCTASVYVPEWKVADQKLDSQSVKDLMLPQASSCGGTSQQL